MKTDYKKLNSFEAAVVAWGFVGLSLAAFIFYSSLTPGVQKNMSVAFNMFDMNETATQVVENLQFAWDVQNDFYEEFYLAFSEVATIPLDGFESTFQATTEVVNIFSTQVAEGYAAQNQIAYGTVGQGKVSGAFIDVREEHVLAEEVEEQDVLSIPYGYSSPSINFNLNALVEAF